MKDMLKRFSVTVTAVVVLIVISALLIADNIGRAYTVSSPSLTDMPGAVIAEKKRKDETEKTCLVLVDSSQENNDIFSEHITEVLEIMRVGINVVDVSEDEIPDFSSYRTAVVVFQDLDALGTSASALLEWVQSGGRAMFFCTPVSTPVFHFLSRYMGIVEGGTSYASFSGMNLKDGFMIGSGGFNFHWGEPMTTAISCRLGENVTVYAESDDEIKAPLVWTAECGEGRFAVMNIGFAEKATRGFTCAVYSLLEDVCVYPVINASAFFLDDFPSPVPMGDGTYIRRDYNRGISSFYSNVWWPDMLSLCDKYGIRYTGMLIDDYTEEVDGSFPQQTDTERYIHFGSLLLNNGGEIGLHGYNHLPLCFTGFDFKGLVNYIPWKSTENAVRALNTAIELGNSLFPENEIAVYVPPSNILSEEGRRLLHDEFPQIKVIASLYLEGQIEYAQEFEVAEDGVIEFPRVISGALLDQYMRWDALNALNLYYVNSHFMHPDDVLDVDRGAEEGWEKLFSNLDDYCQWLYTSAPNIRNLTGSDAGRATARFDSISFEKQTTGDKTSLRLFGFYDEAYFMVRCSKIPVNVSGGEIDRISGDFYLLRAEQETVTIEFETDTDDSQSE